MDQASWRERAGSFGAAADVYDRSRPTYPVEAVRSCLPSGATRVLDLAAGTGKLTQVLLDLGLDVVAVEPSAGMRALVPARADVREGRAEQIPVSDSSVDAVLVGQGFHWFDTGPALAEIARVLRPGGTLGLLWNLREDDEQWVQQVWSLFESGSFADRALEDTPEPPFTPTAELDGLARDAFPNVQQLDPDQLVDLVSSRSGVIVLPEDERVEVLRRTRELAPGDSFELRYRTVTWRAVRAPR